MMRKTPLTRRSRIAPKKTDAKPRKPIRRKKRTKEDALRIYGPEARIKFVTAMPCLIQGQHRCMGEIVDHHVRTGGMGYKADASMIVPLCVAAHTEVHAGVKTFAKVYGLDLTAEAARVESAWLRHCEEAA